jgi:hypothetical protein
MKLSADSLFNQTKAHFSVLGPRFASGDNDARSFYIKRFGWAVLDKEACEGIVTLTHGKVLSIGSGLGAWEACLQPMLADSNRSIICTDIKDQPTSFLPVEKMSCVDAVKRFGLEHETCFFSWPEYRNPHTAQALKSRPVPFPYLVYIGEGMDGCTGDDALHEYLDEMYLCIENISIPQWSGPMGLHDWVQIFKKK